MGLNMQSTLWTVQFRNFSEKRSQVVERFAGSAYRTPIATGITAACYCQRRRQLINRILIRLVESLEKSPSVSGETLDVATLAFSFLVATSVGGLLRGEDIRPPNGKSDERGDDREHGHVKRRFGLSSHDSILKGTRDV